MTKKIKVKGDIIQEGDFSGNIVIVKKYEDISRVGKESIVILEDCPKPIAVMAMHKAKATINVGMEETSHLLLCTSVDHPFASINSTSKEDMVEGTTVNIVFETENKQEKEKKDTLKKQKAVFVDHNSTGQKAARLVKLSNRGFKVPDFEIVGYNIVDEIIKRSEIKPIMDEYASVRTGEMEKDIDAAKKYSDKVKAKIASNMGGIFKEMGINRDMLCNGLSFPVSVRSTANLEDSVEDAMAGVFSSRLGVNKQNFIYEFSHVVSSLFNPEVLLRYFDTMDKIKQSVIIQEMVADPLFSGTLFLHGLKDRDSIVVEGKYKGYGDELMEGTASYDIKAKVSHDLRSMTLESKVENLEHNEMIPRKIHELCMDALEIYKHLGCDDLEFSIDSKGEIWWLQARPLVYMKPKIVHEKVDNIDLSGFYSGRLHYMVFESNLISQIGYQFEQEGDSLNFSISLNHKGQPTKIYRALGDVELEFHKSVGKNPEVLDKVTEYGLAVETEIKKAVQNLGNYSLADLFSLVTLHSGVRNGSFGYRSRYKPLYNNNLWGDQREAWVKKLMHKILDSSGMDITIDQAIDLLYVPIETTSSMLQQRELISAISNESIRYEDIEEILKFQYRAIPNLTSEEGQESYDSKIEEEKDILKDIDIEQAKSSMESLIKNHQYRVEQKKALLSHGFSILEGEEKKLFESFAEFIQMKGTANETHTLYRGIVFMHIAKTLKEKGHSPRDVPVNVLYNEFGFREDDFHVTKPSRFRKEYTK